LFRYKEDKNPVSYLQNGKPSVDKAISLVKLPKAMTICTTVAKPSAVTAIIAARGWYLMACADQMQQSGRVSQET
jgi:hypothetical protein